MNCPKCNGSGFIREYGHIASGMCFQCNGTGIVASNGKAIKSVKASQIKHCLYGTTKAETKLILDCVLDGGSWSSEDASFDRLVSLGHMIKVNGEYIPARWFTRQSISVLLK